MSARRRGRLRALLPGAPPQPQPQPQTPPPAVAWPTAEQYAALKAQRAAIVAQGRIIATQRAIARLSEEWQAACAPDDPLLPRLAQEAAQLTATVAAFDANWSQAQEALGLPPLPELSAAEEADLRLRLQAQGAGQP